MDSVFAAQLGIGQESMEASATSSARWLAKLSPSTWACQVIIMKHSPFT